MATTNTTAKNEKHPLVHAVNNVPTTVGHAVHYTDHKGETHAAILTHLNPETGEASLHVYHRSGTHSDLSGVPHHAEGAQHSWNHLPVK